MDQQITILGLQFSNFVRSVQWLCEEKSIAYVITTEYKNEEVSPGTNALARYHPFSKIPVAIVNDTPICETSTILRLLDTTHIGPSFQPKDPIEKAVADQWSAFVSLYVDTAIVRNVLLEFAFPTGDNGQVRQDLIRRNLGKVHTTLRPVSRQIANKHYLCGNDITLADFLLAPILDYLEQSPLGERFLPANGSLHRYVERMRSRESASRVLLPMRNRKPTAT